MVILYVLTLIVLSIYSYVLVDLNLTLVNHSLWDTFRAVVIEVGYYQRPLSWYIYVTLLILLFVMHFFFLQHHERFSPVRIAGITAVILLGAYPFLSHDIFSYMMDAKILTFYGQNPYVTMPMDFPDDPWIRFTHWTHRTYPYGPVFFVISLVPAFLGMGKFILHYFLLRALFAGAYVGMVFLVSRIDRKHALFLATHPYLLIEGVVNVHNDLIALVLGFGGFYLLWQASQSSSQSKGKEKKQKTEGSLLSSLTAYLSRLRTDKKELWGRVFMLLSGGIKYMTVPYLFVCSQKNHWLNKAAFGLVLALIGYVALVQEFQSWYLINLFLFLPLMPRLLIHLWILFFGLLVSYFPFIYLGGWADPMHVQLKFWIIGVAFVLNATYLGVVYGRENL